MSGTFSNRSSFPEVSLAAIESARARLPKPPEPNWNGQVRRSPWFPWRNDEGQMVHGAVIDGVLFCSDELFLRIEAMTQADRAQRVREMLAGILGGGR